MAETAAAGRWCDSESRGKNVLQQSGNFFHSVHYVKLLSGGHLWVFFLFQFFIFLRVCLLMWAKTTQSTESQLLGQSGRTVQSCDVTHISSSDLLTTKNWRVVRAKILFDIIIMDPFFFQIQRPGCYNTNTPPTATAFNSFPFFFSTLIHEGSAAGDQEEKNNHLGMGLIKINQSVRFIICQLFDSV